MNYLRVNKFAHDEDGAVTIDWVVITAAIVSLSITVMLTVTSGTKTASCTVSSQVAAAGSAPSAGWGGISATSGSC